ncbi:uncharacterized protein F4807DRAFT_217898 [Annulohypoxylon truncatum]|uniref:uncharacterized protein n=1 Tax=Annulohypoxylon truncatum TaxID=327061 RepID=UPI0020073AD5|nr:uncharacterized protein F4807DRAFT_217898 [Annulohypoxylon truncatum]KAI1206900.1 hypothetical protein F4807DRAFT_217898 [Annulohypoxylon truncatum]
MPSRSRGRHDQYDDDPYVFDDPYRNSNSPIGNAHYEYVGTEEPSVVSNKSRRPRSSNPDPYLRPNQPRRDSRTESPPRRSGRQRAYTQPEKPDRKSPPRASRHNSPRRTSSKKAPQNKYQEFSERPAVKRTKSIGQSGLKFISEAAALYAATQGGSGDRERSPSRDRPRSSHHASEPRRHHHHRRHSPSPSPDPPMRRQRAYSDDTRRHRRHRSPSVSDESDYDRDRGRRHRRSRASSSHAYSPSPAPRRRNAKSASSTYRSKPSSKYPEEATAERWQMAARAALEAGGLTAFRLRKDPGSWTGEKGAKVATAALGAAAIDAFIDKDPRRAKTSGVKGFAENTISSLIASKLMGVKGPTNRKGKSRY